MPSDMHATQRRGKLAHPSVASNSTFGYPFGPRDIGCHIPRDGRPHHSKQPSCCLTNLLSMPQKPPAISRHSDLTFTMTRKLRRRRACSRWRYAQARQCCAVALTEADGKEQPCTCDAESAANDVAQGGGETLACKAGFPPMRMHKLEFSKFGTPSEGCFGTFRKSISRAATGSSDSAR